MTAAQNIEFAPIVRPIPQLQNDSLVPFVIGCLTVSVVQLIILNSTCAVKPI